jgi:hypothetical protein
MGKILMYDMVSLDEGYSCFGQFKKLGNLKKKYFLRIFKNKTSLVPQILNILQQPT